ncbi:MAG: hypothetical protein FWC92_01815 [Defluviitaleaceae bacterium]|nr:hypothetical protein [Defluviitaleaceae bacterium]
MKHAKNYIYPAIIAALAVLLILSHLQATAYAQPGTANDPLVTQRYVDERIAVLQAQITSLQNQLGNIEPGTTTSVEAGVVPFTPVFVPRGSTLIAEAGAEFILRSGSANVVAGPNGLVDVTAGQDIANGQPISRNHLILVPATDGRGLQIISDAWLMIKGGYSIVI